MEAAPPNTLEFTDLRHVHDESLLELAYESLYLPTFTAPEEREDLAQYRDRLFGPAQASPQPTTHFLVCGEHLSDLTTRQVLGFLIFEAYLGSGCGLATFLVVAPAARRRGIARQLLDRAMVILQGDMQSAQPNGQLRALFAEAHDPARVDAANEPIDPALRLRALGQLGARIVPIAYVQPSLRPGQERSRNLFFLRLALDLAQADAPVAASVVGDFLWEFYKALGVADPGRDPDYFEMTKTLYSQIHPRNSASPASPVATAALPTLRLI